MSADHARTAPAEARTAGPGEEGRGIAVDVRLFAILRERAGRDRVQLRLHEGATVAEALAALERIPALSGLFERLPMRMAVNRDYGTGDTVLHSGDELALIPPVSGGSAEEHACDRGDIHVAITPEPLSLERLVALVSRPEAGAIVTFQGVTREVESLDYEAYTEMALQALTVIARECLRQGGLEAIAIEHRIGSVPLGEPSVIVAASSAHRPEAFAAARRAIDRIKEDVPIWKREVESDGSARWIH